MLYLFAFFFGRIFLVRRHFKFHFTSSRCTGILRLYGQSFSRLTGISVASTGTSRSPYKRNRENNSKLSTSLSRYTGISACPGTPGSYKQALVKITVRKAMNKSFAFIEIPRQRVNAFYCNRRQYGKYIKQGCQSCLREKKKFKIN